MPALGVPRLWFDAVLLEAVIDPTVDAGLWVADQQNTHTQTHYRKHGFVTDEEVETTGEGREI